MIDKEESLAPVHFHHIKSRGAHQANLRAVVQAPRNGKKANRK